MERFWLRGEEADGGKKPRERRVGTQVIIPLGPRRDRLPHCRTECDISTPENSIIHYPTAPASSPSYLAETTTAFEQKMNTVAELFVAKACGYAVIFTNRYKMLQPVITPPRSWNSTIKWPAIFEMESDEEIEKHQNELDFGVWVPKIKPPKKIRFPFGF